MNQEAGTSRTSPEGVRDAARPHARAGGDLRRVDDAVAVGEPLPDLDRLLAPQSETEIAPRRAAAGDHQDVGA
jgi:hypothetical protein